MKENIVKEEIKQFERYLKRRFGQRSTPKHYLSDVHLFSQHVKGKAATDVTRQDIDQFIEAQQARQLKATTINRRLAALRQFFEFLASQKPDETWPNPVNWQHHKMKAAQPLPRDLNEAQVAQLFSVMQKEQDRHQRLVTSLTGLGSSLWLILAYVAVNYLIFVFRLRHIATLLLNKGMSIEALHKWLGHRSLTMTQRYAHLYDEVVKAQFQQASEQIEGIMAIGWPMPTVETEIEAPFWHETVPM